MKILVALLFVPLLFACAPAPSAGNSSQNNGGSSADVAPARVIAFTDLSSGAVGRLEVALQPDGAMRMVIGR